MGTPQPARGDAINIEACAAPIAVDNRISLPYYFRIASNLLQQVQPYLSPCRFSISCVRGCLIGDRTRTVRFD
jgi:hypothetical protein